ncbi:MAG: DUF4062 domain-containing protein [Methylobacter sp.]|uniref:DUF4062 domain-containing protein n=1 Tax=Methylobacter sp. TaxID=2051955 RepID=UPI00272FFA06|nr:DUF4062 domain-containing protein [Methylobacter sp.]MDP1666509.1 DUF4062 domain-containing protein [Methylobacter sp.]
MTEIKYQVFVSSTYTDLIEERENIIKAILEMYHIPIGMEMFSAEDEDQWEIIRRTIEVSDYYILVLGLRYGSKTTENISFTQKEYEYALEKNIPVLAFIMNDSVSLSKDKRDDDLTEINTFREMVLKNSKMAQFWKKKDELIKNVSISLMKQIMQKPGIGWVRGDKAISAEALSHELTSLSKENRSLRDTIKELESKIIPKYPKIELSINALVVDSKFNTYKRLAVPEKININDVDEHLKEHISEEEIRQYNDSIPSQSEIDEYNSKYEQFYKIKGYSSYLVLTVFNTGTVKANNLYIDIKFPDEVLVIDDDKRMEEPQNPIPYTPIKWAETRYEKTLQKDKNTNSMLNSLLNPGYGGIGTILQPRFNMPKIRPINQQWWTKLDGNKLTLKINSLLHTRCFDLDEEYLIVPLKIGKHSVEISFICEELETKKKQIIELDVQEKL